MQQQIVLEPDSTSPAGAAAAAAAGGAAGSGDASNLPLEIQRGLMRAGIPIIGSAAAVRAMAEGLGRGDLFQGAAGPSAAAAAAAVPAKQVQPSAARKRVLNKAVKQWLTTYNGDPLAGWQIRPKVKRHGYGCYGRAGWSVSGWLGGGVP